MFITSDLHTIAKSQPVIVRNGENKKLALVLHFPCLAINVVEFHGSLRIHNLAESAEDIHRSYWEHNSTSYGQGSDTAVYHYRSLVTHTVKAEIFGNFGTKIAIPKLKHDLKFKNLEKSITTYTMR